MSPDDIQAAADLIDRLRPKAHAAPSHSRGGVLISTMIETDEVIETDIVVCGHCDYHWLWLPNNSGNPFGYCMHCGKLLCGRPFCRKLSCTHPEQRLENMEAGRAFDFRPITISVDAAVPRG